MKLLGVYRSPYVRRVAATLNFMGIPFEHEPVPVFDTPELVRQHNPVVRVPTLVLDDGEALVESFAILDWLDEQAGPAKRLTPASGLARRAVMKTTAVAIAAIDKTIWAAYEPRFHPKEKVHQPWIDHNEGQAMGGFKWLDGEAAKAGSGWLCGDKMSQADVTSAIGFTFVNLARPKLGVAEACPHLAKLAARLEAMPELVACRPPPA
jgi:glutathione S-transferase